jgi:hypothetical protein
MSKASIVFSQYLSALIGRENSRRCNVIYHGAEPSPKVLFQPTKKRQGPDSLYHKTDELLWHLDSRQLQRVVYQRGHRNSIIFGLSGLLFKSHVSLVSNIISRLCDCTNDEEKSSRLEVVNNTYLNGVDGREIKGTSQLLETLAAVNEGDKDYARCILENIPEIVGSKNGEGKDDNNYASTAEILIQLAEESTSLFFKDQYNIAYAKINVQEHNEIIALTSQDAINNAIGGCAGFIRWPNSSIAFTGSMGTRQK